jgi:DNA helicase-2/ATP-dependent DNA helicase PcrA
VPASIACVYCGGTHASPAEVKACWHTSSGTMVAAADSATAADARPASTVLATAAVPSPAVDATASLRAPSALGRGIVVGAGTPVPAPWSDAERVVVDADVVTSPAEVVARLRAAAHERRAVVVELQVELASHLDARAAEVESRPAHVVGPRHEFLVDALRHLVWSNAVDLRVPDSPRWWLLDAAAAVGARARGARDTGDIELPGGTAVWLEGGPARTTAAIAGVDVVHAVAVEHGSLHGPVPATDQPNGDRGLAPDQYAAVAHEGGAARIIAPAGSGKTRVLTERARRLISVWRLPPAAVTLVAFNKRAQEEMQQRTADVRGLHVRTLNAIALAIVNGAPPFAPQPRTWRTIDEPDVRRIIGSLVSFPRRRNTDPVAPWIEALSLVRLGLLDPAVVEARYDGDVDGLPDVWPRFRAALEREGAVDFDDQIHRAIDVLLTDPVARAAAQRACRLLLVDEFQDLTPAHLLLVRLLAAPGGAVFGVGDDDQTIYGYNGADPGWLIDFTALFPGAAEHPLEVNYRCPAGLVGVADRLVRHNRRRVAKTIRAASHDPNGWSVDADGDPVAGTLAAVRRAIDAGSPASDVTVLTRVNASLAPVQAALVGAGVPISGGVGLEFLDRTTVRAALAWLRLGARAVGSGGSGRFATDDLREALRRPSRPLPPRVAEWLAEQHDLEGIRRLAGRLNEVRDADRVAAFADDVASLQSLVTSRADTGTVLDRLLDDIGLAGAVATLDSTRRGMNRSAQGDDLAALRHLGRLHPDVATFERWLRDQLAARRAPDGVLLSTVHRVKGQEWPFVVVHLADAEQFPHRLADDVEEERRLFHVAITRARRHVTIVTGDRPSPFVAELSTEPPAWSADDPDPPTVRSRDVRPPRRDAATSPAHPLLDKGRVHAAPGLVLEDQGVAWRVVAVADDAVATEQVGATHEPPPTRRFTLGTAVVTAGRQRGELRAAPPGLGAASLVAFDELRRFRERVRAGKPAYTVFDDRTLAAIADALPSTAQDLARVRGVGPAKLESYGDDVLALVAEALDAAEPTVPARDVNAT